MAKKILVSVAWPYANGYQHLGHLAGAYLPSDVFGRYQRLVGNDVLMVSGSDAHGTPITVRADAEGKPPREVFERYHKKFLETYQQIGLTFDLFTHTDTENHHRVSQDIFVRILENGYLYKEVQRQLYSPQEGRFLPDRYVEGTCPHCGYTDARGDQCDNCGKLLEPTELLGPRSKASGDTNLEVRETDRVLADGTMVWATDGISLCTWAAAQFLPILVSDGASGAIVAWEDHRGADADIYAQRVYSDGTMAWTTGGIFLSVAAGDQGGPAITTDGAGGAIVTWHGGCGGSPGICAQRVHPDGSVAWTPGGVTLNPNPAHHPQIVGDQAGGAIVVWQTEDSAVDLYAQRVYSDGLLAWPIRGVPVTLASGAQHSPALVEDQGDGTIVTWQDERQGFGYPLVYAQRIRGDGTVPWAVDGLRWRWTEAHLNGTLTSPVLGKATRSSPGEVQR